MVRERPLALCIFCWGRSEYIDMEKKCWIKNHKICFAIIIILCFGIVISIPGLIHLIFDADFSTLGTYGDFFGMLNFSVSALAFGGVIASLYYQRQDLKLQRRDLELTRIELKKQAVAQENSVIEQRAYSALLSEQIEKSIRPYLNIYLDFNGESHALIVKNVGKSACRNFSIESELRGSVESQYEEYARKLLNVLNSIKLDVIPSGNEYAIQLDSIITGESLTFLYNSNLSLEMKFMFDGLKNKKETFTMKFNLNYGILPTKRSSVGANDIVKSLNSLNETIKQFRNLPVPMQRR